MGFTSGIALTIFSTQIKDFFGLTTPRLPSGFVEKWGVYLQHLDTASWPTAFIAILAAIALPAYQDYTAKADVGNAVGGLAGEKIKVDTRDGSYLGRVN